MSLEHLVTISDAQDMGSIQHNLQAQRFRDSFIAEKCDPENTTIVDVGDRIDLHAFRSRYFDQDDLNRCNEEVVQELEVEVPKLIDKVIPDEAILELLKKSRNEGENDLKDASPEEIRQFKENIVQAQFNQEGLAYLAGSLKTTGEEFIEKGFNTYEVVGNNEIFSLFNESMISSDGKIDLKKYFQALNEYKRILNRSGIEAIDDYKLRNIGG